MNFREDYDTTHRYRLIELPEQVLKELAEDKLLFESGGEKVHYPLTLRGRDKLCLCNKNTTWSVKQRSQSNILHVVKPTEDGLSSIFVTQPILECAILENPILDTSELPIYDGDTIMSDGNNHMDTVKLRAQSMLSGVQFDAAWSEVGGVEVDGVACIVSENLVKDTVDDILTSLASQKRALNLVQAQDIETDSQQAVLESVLKRFATTPVEPYSLDLVKIVAWVGRHVLSESMVISVFMEKWKNAIPMIIDDSMLDLDLIKGHYALCDEKIHKLSECDLSDDPKKRFAQLFAIKPKWEITEMTPFIETLRVNKSVKVENFVLKYAKKRKEGGKIVVSAT